MSARRVRGGVLAALALSLAATTSTSAQADEAVDKVACAKAYERGQRFRRSHELRASHDELLVCARPECPAGLRKECTQWLGEVDVATPTILVSARTADDKPVSDLHVRIDGETLGAEAAHGAIPLDPGTHVVRLEAAGFPSLEEHVTLREGERGRRIAVTFSAASTPPPPPPPGGSEEGPPRPPSSNDERPVPPVVWVVGGAGLVAGVIGGVFQISGMTKRADLDACAPRCPQSNVDDARRSLWIGNVVLGVGAVALATALVLYLTRPTTTRASATTANAR